MSITIFHVEIKSQYLQEQMEENFGLSSLRKPGPKFKEVTKRSPQDKHMKSLEIFLELQAFIIKQMRIILLKSSVKQ